MSNLEKINVLTKNKLDTLDLTQYPNQIFGTTDENAGESRDVQHHIMTAMLPANYVFLASRAIEKLPIELFNSVGEKLTFSNGNIIIGKGVSKIKASYHASVGGTAPLSGSTHNDLYVYLVKNDEVYINNQTWWDNQYQVATIDSTDILIDVKENDTLGLSAYTVNATNVVSGSLTTRRTYLTIEVVQ